MPPIPDLKETAAAGLLFALRTLKDMDYIIQRIASIGKTAHVVVIGGGPIGLEMVEALHGCGLAVTVVEAMPQVMGILDPELTTAVMDELVWRGVDVRLCSKVVSIEDQPQADSVAVHLDNGDVLSARFVLQSIGVRPESNLASEAGLEVNQRRAIVVNRHMQTSDPAIYSVGDVACTPYCEPPRQVWLPLGGAANRMARIAAEHMVLGDDADAEGYPGSFGTCIIRVFDAVSGRTGLNETGTRAQHLFSHNNYELTSHVCFHHRSTDCKRAGREYGVNTVVGPSHASYYPGSTPTTVKVVYDKASKKLLGGQVVGHFGVDKRLDVLATALEGGLTVTQLAHLDLAYAPPYSSARDVIHTAGFAARNDAMGLLVTCSSLEPAPGEEAALLLDVRDSSVVAVRPVAAYGDVLAIPLEQLRDRLDEVTARAPEGRPIIVVCDLGKLSYFASRVLRANGFSSVKSLAGGLQSLPRKSVGPSLATASSAPSSSPAAPALDSAVAPSKASSLAQEEVLDVCGVACPGPIMAVRKRLPSLAPGQTLQVRASDPGFLSDFPAFCRVNGLEVLSVEKAGGVITGRMRNKGEAPAASASPPVGQASSETTAIGAQDVAIIVFSGEMDKVMAAFVIANGAIAMGGKATLFFTFWGLEALRSRGKRTMSGHGADGHSLHGEGGGSVPHPSKSMMDTMMSAMLPKGAEALHLSHMQFAGVGPVLMKMQMAQKHLPDLPGLMRDAVQGGARLVACTMSMSALGITEEELVEGVTLGGVADFLEVAGKSKTTLFI
jgi:NADPH-dependent 2,4-dienoyl-CoA reductase/sulfur reductase-like enzyme/peroxiredoxin family protein/TusA-related sulfurtransferase/rhodanese-related sulfurtransferase